MWCSYKQSVFGLKPHGGAAWQGAAADITAWKRQGVCVPRSVPRQGAVSLRCVKCYCGETGFLGMPGQSEGDLRCIPEILASSASGDQARDANVPQIPQMTCLVEVLEERETAILGEEVHEIPGDGVQVFKDACVRCRSCRSSGDGRCLESVFLWGEGAEEGEDAAPRDATVPGARAPLDVGGGGGEMGAL